MADPADAPDTLAALDAAWRRRDIDTGRADALAREHAASPHEAVACAAACLAGFRAFRRGELDEALRLGLEARASAEARGDATWTARALNVVGIGLAVLGRGEEAVTAFVARLEAARAAGDAVEAAGARHDLALVTGDDDPEGAARELEGALADFEAAGDPEGAFLARYNLALLEHADDPAALAEALGVLEELARAQGWRERTRMAALSRIEALAAGGRLAEAEAGLEPFAAAVAGGERDEALAAAVAGLRGDLLQARGDAAGAAAAFERAAELHRGGDAESLEAMLGKASRAREAAGDLAAALALLREAMAVRDESRSREARVRARALEVAFRTRAAQEEAERERARSAQLERYLEEMHAMHDRVRELSLRDPLTGLHNRRHLIDAGARLVAHAHRYGRPLCAMLFDLDHFKRINDRHSHPTGDEVLVRTAALVRSELRDADLFARYGGEEFLVILPETPLGTARAVAERLRLALLAQPWERVAPGLRVSASFGVVELRPEEALETLLSRADEKLYEAKRAGRDRVKG